MKLDGHTCFLQYLVLRRTRSMVRALRTEAYECTTARCGSEYGEGPRTCEGTLDSPPKNFSRFDEAGRATIVDS